MLRKTLPLLSVSALAVGTIVTAGATNAVAAAPHTTKSAGTSSAALRRTEIVWAGVKRAAAARNAAAAAPNADFREQLMQNDFAYEGVSQRATFLNGKWAIDDSGYKSFGAAGDFPTVTTDGDGQALIGVFRPSSATWYLGDDHFNVSSTIQYGTKGDLPVQAHYLGIDEPSNVGVFRPSTGYWYVRDVASVQYGQKGDIPVPGHYDGAADNYYADVPAVFRPSNGAWYRIGFPSVTYGQAGDIPVPADYNGDGTTDIGVFRPSNGTWYIQGQKSVVWGIKGDVPVTDDFNGDGKADIAVYRPSNKTWYVHGGPSGALASPAGATPIGAAPYTD